MDNSLIHAMALHAFAYCERLFYIEEVGKIRIAGRRVYVGRTLHQAEVDTEVHQVRYLFRPELELLAGPSVCRSKQVAPGYPIERRIFPRGMFTSWSNILIDSELLLLRATKRSMIFTGTEIMWPIVVRSLATLLSHSKKVIPAHYS